MSILEQNTIQKRQVNKLLKLESEQELDVRDNKKYELDAICDGKIYAKENISQLSRLYYFVS